MRLYDNLSSGNAYKVRLVLHQLGKTFERVEIDIDRGETRTPEFLAKNPNGRVPVLEIEPGVLLAESNAIISYLGEGTPLVPEGRLERARMLQWMFFEQYSHEPNIATPRYWITHQLLTPEREALLPAKRKLGYDALGVMERHLAGKGFFVAGRYTLADVALYAYTHVAEEGGFDLSPYEAVRAWLARVAAQPGHVPITEA